VTLQPTSRLSVLRNVAEALRADGFQVPQAITNEIQSLQPPIMDYNDANAFLLAEGFHLSQFSAPYYDYQRYPSGFGKGDRGEIITLVINNDPEDPDSVYCLSQHVDIHGDDYYEAQDLFQGPLSPESLNLCLGALVKDRENAPRLAGTPHD